MIEDAKPVQDGRRFTNRHEALARAQHRGPDSHNVIHRRCAVQIYPAKQSDVRAAGKRSGKSTFAELIDQLVSGHQVPRNQHPPMLAEFAASRIDVRAMLWITARQPGDHEVFDAILGVS